MLRWSCKAPLGAEGAEPQSEAGNLDACMKDIQRYEPSQAGPGHNADIHSPSSPHRHAQ